ncbi:unnamed protein product [Rotaria sordida]|uniref:Uncharacterized protein n=1 Tax=Rotaria sordida TaxID=392033 RepID=A0A813W1P4_9BILA|nr:unnamed protein product [Rotaria sordida]
MCSVFFCAKVEAFRKAINEHFSKQISNGEEYDVCDIKRFNEINEYTFMFIQYRQHDKTFDEPKAFRHFHETMT